MRRLLAEKGIAGEALRGISESEARILSFTPIEDAHAEADLYKQIANNAQERCGGPDPWGMK